MARRSFGQHDAASLRGQRRWRQWVAAAGALVVGLGATALLANYYNQEASRQAHIAATSEAGRLAERAATLLEPMNSFTQAVKAMITSDPDTVTHAELQGFLSDLYGEWGGVKSVAVAPGNRVSAVAPLAENVGALGLYYPDNPEQWPGVRDAMRSGQPALLGPYEMVQGGQGYVYRLPVYLDDGSYWGEVSAVVEADALAGPADDAPTFAMRKADEESVVLVGDPETFTDAAGSVELTILDQRWDVAVPRQPTDDTVVVAIVVVGVAASLVMALLVFLLAGSLDRYRALALLMKDLSDQAPGVLFQLRQQPNGTRTMTYTSSGVVPLLEGQADRGTEDITVLEDLIHPDDRDAVDVALDESARTAQPWHQRFRVVLPSRETTWLLADARPRVESGGEVVWNGWVGDITDDLRDEDALRVSASLFEVTRDGVAILDSDGRLTSINAGMEIITGYARDEVIGTLFADYCAGFTPADVLDDMWQHLDRHGFWRGEITGRRKDGTTRAGGAVAIAVHDEDGRLSHYIIVLDNTNITRDDPVTGLPNVRLLDDGLREAQAEAGTHGGRTALVVIGLNQFRRVNDMFGHRVGDQLLEAVARRLTDAVPPGCLLARLRGDEFAVAVMDARSPADVDAVTRSALESLSTPFGLSGRSVHASATAGISLCPDDAATVADMHFHANHAMRTAKGLGPGQHSYFDPQMQIALQERARLVDDLQAALGSDQLTMVFQPIMDLRTGAFQRAEALMRWKHPVLGPVPPDRFIPLAEENGFIHALSDIAFARSTEALLLLRDVVPDFQVSVNLSPKELHESDHLHPVRVRAISELGLPGSALIVEITEGVLVSDEPVVDENLDVYRKAGLRFAIDDFGTGYSSLAYLQKLDVHYLKIDRTFVDAISDEGDGLALCQAIIEMAHKMGIKVIAEGVETPLQNSLLTEAGCDYAQGYLHARPMPIDELLALVTSSR
jgi:diguanylate cyclase (GGDEF)-like protein/PAS domain S-box-containing protein